MSGIVEIKPALQALAGNIIFLSIDEHFGLLYIGLAIIFACFLIYMFVYNKRH